jgi:hypothetical protein
MDVIDDLWRHIDLEKYMKTMDVLTVEEKPNIIVNLLQMINIS